MKTAQGEVEVALATALSAASTDLVSSLCGTSCDLIGQVGHDAGGMVSRGRDPVGSFAGLMGSRLTPLGT